MDCVCSQYKEIMENTKAALSKIKMEIFSTRLELSRIEEKSIKERYENKNELKDCCQIDRDKTIDLEVELYLAVVELEAYKAKLYRRDPAFVARKRNEALEAYRLKYEADLMERGEAQYYDAADLMERGEFDEID